MTEPLHDIDDLFKDPIDGHREEAPPDVWNRIDQALDKRQAAFYKRKYFTVRYAAIALLFIGLGGLATIAYLKLHRKAESDRVHIPNRSLPAAGDSGLADHVNKKANERKASEGDHASGLSKDTIVFNSYKQTNAEGHTKKGMDENASVDEPKKLNGTLVDRAMDPHRQFMGSKNQKHGNGSGIDQRFDRREKKDLAAHSVSPRIDTGREDRSGTTEPNGSKSQPLTASRKGLEDSFKTGRLRRDKIMPSITDHQNIVRAQPVARSAHAPDGFRIMPFYGRGANMNQLRDNDRFRDPRNNRDEARRTEGADGVALAGVLLQKGITRNLGLEAGISYFVSSTHIGPKTLFAKADNNGEVHYEYSCSSGNSYLPVGQGPRPNPGDSIRVEAAQSRISYLSVPLGLSYRFELGKVSIRPSLGVAPNFLLRGRLSSDLPAGMGTGKQPVANEINGLKKMYLSAYFQPELAFRMSNRLSFELIPHINLSLSPINKGTAVRTFQNTAGLAAGFSIRL